MSDEKQTVQVSDIKAAAVLAEKDVKVIEKASIDALNQRGYGTIEKNGLTLAFYEALYLTDKKELSIRDKKGTQIDFNNLLQICKETNENAWTKYLLYRDLRSRGYVVREGFGKAIDFRIYERGTYGKEAAASLVLSTQEGQPLPVKDLAYLLAQTQSLKKELILAVMNRRGEIVYYSVSPLTFK